MSSSTPVSGTKRLVGFDSSVLSHEVVAEIENFENNWINEASKLKNPSHRPNFTKEVTAVSQSIFKMMAALPKNLPHATLLEKLKQNLSFGSQQLSLTRARYQASYVTFKEGSSIFGQTVNTPSSQNFSLLTPPPKPLQDTATSVNTPPNLRTIHLATLKSELSQYTPPALTTRAQKVIQCAKSADVEHPSALLLCVAKQSEGLSSEQVKDLHKVAINAQQGSLVNGAALIPAGVKIATDKVLTAAVVTVKAFTKSFARAGVIQDYPGHDMRELQERIKNTDDIMDGKNPEVNKSFSKLRTDIKGIVSETAKALVVGAEIESYRGHNAHELQLHIADIRMNCETNWDSGVSFIRQIYSSMEAHDLYMQRLYFTHPGLVYDACIGSLELATLSLFPLVRAGKNVLVRGSKIIVPKVDAVKNSVPLLDKAVSKKLINPTPHSNPREKLLLAAENLGAQLGSMHGKTLSTLTPSRGYILEQQQRLLKTYDGVEFFCSRQGASFFLKRERVIQISEEFAANPGFAGVSLNLDLTDFVRNAALRETTSIDLGKLIQSFNPAGASARDYIEVRALLASQGAEMGMSSKSVSLLLETFEKAYQKKLGTSHTEEALRFYQVYEDLSLALTSAPKSHLPSKAAAVKNEVKQNSIKAAPKQKPLSALDEAIEKNYQTKLNDSPSIHLPENSVVTTAARSENIPFVPPKDWRPNTYSYLKSDFVRYDNKFGNLEFSLFLRQFEDKVLYIHRSKFFGEETIVAKYSTPPFRIFKHALRALTNFSEKRNISTIIMAFDSQAYPLTSYLEQLGIRVLSKGSLPTKNSKVLTVVEFSSKSVGEALQKVTKHPAKTNDLISRFIKDERGSVMLPSIKTLFEKKPAKSNLIVPENTALSDTVLVNECSLNKTVIFSVSKANRNTSYVLITDVTGKYEIHTAYEAFKQLRRIAIKQGSNKILIQFPSLKGELVRIVATESKHLGLKQDPFASHHSLLDTFEMSLKKHIKSRENHTKYLVNLKNESERIEQLKKASSIFVPPKNWPGDIRHLFKSDFQEHVLKIDKIDVTIFVKKFETRAFYFQRLVSFGKESIEHKHHLSSAKKFQYMFETVLDFAERHKLETLLVAYDSKIYPYACFLESLDIPILCATSLSSFNGSMPVLEFPVTIARAKFSKMGTPILDTFQQKIPHKKI